MALSGTLLLLALASASPEARAPSPGTPLTIAIYGPYLSQPGLKLGTYLELLPWTVERRRGARWRSLFLGPQLGLFTRPGNHVSALLNAELGYRSLLPARAGLFTATSIAVGHLIEFEIVSYSVDLGSGAQRPRREARSYALPTLNFAVGQEFRPRLGWYAKASIGRSFAALHDGALFYAIEIGLQLRLGARDEEGAR